MHSLDEGYRLSAKYFFVQRCTKSIHMSLENVGKCDDIIWKIDRKKQEQYYPFMDALHSTYDIQRVPYTEVILDVLNKEHKGLSLFKKLTLAITVQNKGILYTFDQQLLSLGLDFVKQPVQVNEESVFQAAELEELYVMSLVLRI